MELTGLVVGGVALLAATVFGLVARARQGKVRRVVTTDPPISLLSSLGVQPGETTLLQFSSAFCAPCRATRVICAEVARTTPGVTHLEVDAESHLDAVRELEIWRTPTTLIVDASARVVARASGVPTLAQLRQTIAAIPEFAAAPPGGRHA